MGKKIKRFIIFFKKYSGYAFKSFMIPQKMALILLYYSISLPYSNSIDCSCVEIFSINTALKINT